MSHVNIKNSPINKKSHGPYACNLYPSSFTGEDILHALEFIPYTAGGTFTADGLRVMREDVFNMNHGDRQDARNLVLMVTDGTSNILPQRTIPEARKVRDISLHIVIICHFVKVSKPLSHIANDLLPFFFLTRKC